jgi:hypothetical protein
MAQTNKQTTSNVRLSNVVVRIIVAFCRHLPEPEFENVVRSLGIVSASLSSLAAGRYNKYSYRTGIGHWAKNSPHFGICIGVSGKIIS